MTDNGPGLEVGHQVKYLVQAVDRHLTDPRVQGPGPQIHERRVKRDANPRFPQNIGHPKKLFPGRAVKDMAVETDFGIDLLFDDNGEILMKELLEG
jgi:hypothetical protein